MRKYVVCPRCFNPMLLTNGIWVCMVCGYSYESKRSRLRSKKIRGEAKSPSKAMIGFAR